MIRTALLAGIFLVLLSLAYSRSGPSVLPAAQEEAVSAKVEPRPVKHVAQAPALEPVRKAEAHVEAPPVAAPTPQSAPQPAPQIAAPPIVEAEVPVVKTPPAPVAAPVVAQDVPLSAPKSAGQPVSLLPPEMQPKQAAPAPLLPPEAAPAAAPAPVAPVAPPVVAQAVAPPAITPGAEIPTVQVAARTAAAPYDVPSGSAHVAVADPGAAKPADAPKFMTPQERSKELYRLAREMEDTFIHKLAR